MATSRCVSRATVAGFHQIPSLPCPAAATAPPVAMARAPTGRLRNTAPSPWATAGRAMPAPASARPTAASAQCRLHEAAERSERRRLIDEHDGNSVADREGELAGRADQTLLVRLELETPLAARTDEELQQVGRHGHGRSSWARRYPKRSMM